MRTEVKTVKLTCDLCGQETHELWNSVSEEHPVGVKAMTYDIWYGGVYEVQDICKPCQFKLEDFLRQNKMYGHGQKRR